MTNPYKARRILPPIPSGYPLDDVFSVLVPVARTNLIANPSLETNTTGWTAVGGSIARSATQQYHGAYSLAVTPTAGTSDGCYYGTVTLTLGQLYAVSAKVYGQAGVTYKISVATTGGADLAAYQFTATGRWQWVWIYWQETTGASRRVYISKVNSSDTHVFYIDGAQVEAINAGETVSTYLDGDQQGLVPNQYPPPYGWTGTPHASTSYRTALTRAGGQVMRLKDYGFLLTAIVGLGLATPQNVTLDYAQLDGGQDVYTRKSARQFALVGQFRAGSYFELRENRSAVASVLDRDAAALDQPLILRHHLEDGCGNILSDEVRIACKYAGGLSGNTATISGEGLSLSFQQQIPLVLSDAEQGAALSVQATVANANRILYRAPTGAWSALGVGVSGGAVPIVYALARGPDGAIYVGGDFTDGGGSGADYLAKYDPNTGAWSALGSVTAINGPVFALAVGPDGTLYAGGAFTNAGGIAAADYIAKWTGSAWAALATGANDRVEALAIDRYGNLYAGGGFTLMAGVANTVRIAKWNGSAWSALGTGVADNDVLGIAASGDSVFIVGSFTSVGGVGTTDEIAEWTGTQWVAVSGGGLDGGTGGITAYAAADGYVYIGGNFTSAGNVGYTNVVRYGGVDFRPVGSEAPLNSAVYAFANDPGGVVYVGGAFTTVNGVSVPDGLARWDGSTWRQTDVNLPSTAIVYAILATPDGGLYLGFNTGGSAIAAAVTSVVNSGSAHAYPTVTIKGPSSGSSRIYQLINYTTGKAIYFNLTINAGETVTLRFDPLNQGITSDFQGNLIGTILSGSSLSGFDLQSGANNISLYADNSTVTAVMQWRPRYASLDAVP